MAKKILPTDNNSRMAAQIDEIYNRLSLVEDLLTDLAPALEKISKETHETVKELREKFERDETLTLLKKVGDNIPTFVELLNVMEAVKGLMTDAAPALGKITKETHETVKELREKFERDETLTLLKKVGDNIPTFVELLNVMEAVKGLMADAAPALGKITKETHETVKELREKFERDETLMLLKKVGDNIPTFVELLNVMEVVKGLMTDVSPAIGKISKEVTPTINMLRESLEKDEALELLQKTGENIGTFNKLLDFLNNFEKEGKLDFTLEKASAKEMDYMMIGLQKTLLLTVKQYAEMPPKPGIKNLLSAMKDPDVQKGILFMTAMAKNLSRCLTEACMIEPPKK